MKIVFVIIHEISQRTTRNDQGEKPFKWELNSYVIQLEVKKQLNWTYF